MNVVLLGSNTKEEIENNLRIVVASAGALSRSEGTVMDVYESKKIIRKIYVLPRQ